MLLLIEMADVELLSTRLFLQLTAANVAFQALAEENHVSEYPFSDLTQEATGTLRLAGDDSYSVQLIRIALEDSHGEREG